MWTASQLELMEVSETVYHLFGYEGGEEAVDHLQQTHTQVTVHRTYNLRHILPHKQYRRLQVE